MSGEQTSLPTASEGHESFMFDGIFRDVHSKETRNKILEAQTRVAQGDWSGARYLLEEALDQSRDPHDVKNVQLILDEAKRYQTNAIAPDCKPAPGVDWDDLLERRPVEMLFESWHDTPQSVFFVRHEHRPAASDHGIAGHVRFTVGRRILSHQFRSGNIRELHCSLVTPSMLLGTLEDQRLREDGVVVYFRPFSDNEKLYLMQRMMGDLTVGELVFPFPVLEPGSIKELSCPPDGWEIDEPLAEQLGQGEVIIRDYTKSWLKSLGRDDLRLYDPACSTGQFLSTMREAVAKAYLIGQDLSAHMVSFAKKRLDEIHCGNAVQPKIPEQSCDVCFVRFLNSEVVKVKDVLSILTPLSRTVKVGGHLVIFGHTPVLLSAADLRRLHGWTLLQCLGGGERWGGLFQFYVVMRDI